MVTLRLCDKTHNHQFSKGIADQSSYIQKKDLPFDNRGHNVSVMAIKAIGTVTENLGDGRQLKVNWTRIDHSHKWYFSTYRNTVSLVMPGTWKTDALIGFTFDGIQQDIELFRNAPQWCERFGNAAVK
jgi:5-methylcytosine-specific restriction enzyme B